MVSPLGLMTISGSRVKRPTKITRFTIWFSFRLVPPPCPCPEGRDIPASWLSTTSRCRRLEEREWIDRHACDAHLEVQVRSGTVAGRSHESDRLSRGNDVARLYERPVEMAVQRAELRIAGQQNVETVAATLAAKRDGPGGGGVDRSPERRRQVDSAVEVMARAARRPGLDFERAAAVRLRQGRLLHRQDQRTRLGLLRLDDNAGQQEGDQQKRNPQGEGGPPPGPCEERQASGRQ